MTHEHDVKAVPSESETSAKAVERPAFARRREKTPSDVSGTDLGYDAPCRAVYVQIHRIAPIKTNCYESRMSTKNRIFQPGGCTI